MLNRTLTVYNLPNSPVTLGIFISIMAREKFDGELTPEDITDLYNDFTTLRDFVEELTGILFDNDELPDRIKQDIHELFIKKF